MAFAQSPQSFIRALKAASDPPEPGLPTKIEIASQVWANATLHIPNKGEVIGDWILTRLSKDRGKEVDNPVLDFKTWVLLADIIAPSESPLHVYSSRTWLISSMNRVNIVPIVIAFLRHVTETNNGTRELILATCRCLSVLWPLGVHKLQPDALLECFSAVMDIACLQADNHDLAEVCCMIDASFRECLRNVTNKKKLYSTFLYNHLDLWIKSVTATSDAYTQLRENIYTTGVEVLFSMEILRQTHEANIGQTLFDALGDCISTISDPDTLGLLPRLFNSFMECTIKHRGSLFNQGSNLTHGSIEEVRVFGMRFFDSCQSFLMKHSSTDDRWLILVELLAVVDEHNLFSALQLDAAQLLKQLGELAVASLKTPWKQKHIGRTQSILKALIAITRIDHELISLSLPRLMPILLVTGYSTDGGSYTEAITLLDLLLDYHSKTRTMHTYISSVFNAMNVRQVAGFSGGPQAAYFASSAGVLLHRDHLEHLSRCIKIFTTPAEISDIVQSTLSSLTECWNSFHQKRLEQEPDGDSSAITFSLRATLASCILSALPSHQLLDSARKQIGLQLGETVAHCNLKDTLKAIRKRNRQDGWALQIILAATLRFQYGLHTMRYLNCTLQYDAKLSARMMDLLADVETLPELSIEIFRNHFCLSAGGYLSQPNLLINSALEYLDTNLNKFTSSWSGLACQLTFGVAGKQKAALALLHMILQRWLPVVDVLASERQLKELARVIATVDITPTSLLPHQGSDVNANVLILGTMRSAEFWELPNLRNVFLSFLAEETALVTDVVPHKATKKWSSKSASILTAKSEELYRIIIAYQILLFFPADYISRTLRMDMVIRAVAMDAFLRSIPSDYTLLDSCQYLTTLRVSLLRFFSHSGSVELSAQDASDFLYNTILLKQYVVPPTADYSSATLDLVRENILALFRSTDVSKISGFIGSLSQHDFITSISMNEPSYGIIGKSLVRLIDVLRKEFLLSQIAQEVQLALKSFFVHLSSTFLPALSNLAGEKSSASTLAQNQDLLIIWCHIIAFGHWLQSGISNAPRLGYRLLAILFSSSEPQAEAKLWDDTAAAVFAILLEELVGYLAGERSLPLSMIIAAYVQISRITSSSGRATLDRHLSAVCKSLSTKDFSDILDLCSEYLSSEDYTTDNLENIVAVSNVLLHDAPEGTLKSVQPFATKCLNVFVSRNAFSHGPLPLRIRVLDFVAQHCSDRPAALRVNDLGGIWTLLSKFLAQSSEHDNQTSSTIFRAIISTISSLIRLRRDLVLLTLPHLGAVLRQLILAIRSARPQLGGKQTKLVNETLPRWVNAAQPLTAEDGKVLARLFVALTNKTVVRTHGSVAEDTKAESLAKPFSKHAAYVLKAYIDAMNDPLCVLPLELRKELMPGLYALCDMLGDHNRDSLMMSALEAGGRLTMKTLWKEYEKQRYVGKG